MTLRTILYMVLLSVLGVGPVLAAGFDHDVHVRIKDSGCDVCHVPGVDFVPSEAICLYCHDDADIRDLPMREPKTHGPLWSLNHRNEAKLGVMDCAVCHEQSYCLDCHKAGFAHEQGRFSNSINNVHRSDFHVTHPIAARTDQQFCATCHEPNFCSDCHDRFRLRGDGIGSPSHRRTFDLGVDSSNEFVKRTHEENAGTPCDTCHTRDTVAPDAHSWSIGHAREARRNLTTCQACHPDGDVCLKCHGGLRGGVLRLNPHGDGWGDRKGGLKDASNGKTCRKCHQRGDY